MNMNEVDQSNNGIIVQQKTLGDRVKAIRLEQGLSLRALALLSGLNVNTLSLIENNKTSPSVSTLQQLATALKVPITRFFHEKPILKQVVFTPVSKRPSTSTGCTQIQDLGQNFAGNAVQALMVSLLPGRGSGERMIVHTGHEFVLVMRGSVQYQIDKEIYSLQSGDSLLFQAHLPHRWENSGEEPAEFMLFLHPSEMSDTPLERHFESNSINKEFLMKIAFITDDGKTISQHFGRAPFYLVVTIEDGKVTDREMRSKLGHNQFSNQPHIEGHHGAGHGFDPASHDRHLNMAQAISDCREVICGGMGMGAYESMKRLNITPVVTDITDIEAALQAYLEGKLTDHTELLH